MQTRYYQVTVDESSHTLKISRPWYSKILEWLDCRTNLSKSVTQHLFQEIKDNYNQAVGKNKSLLKMMAKTGSSEKQYYMPQQTATKLNAMLELFKENGYVDFWGRYPVSETVNTSLDSEEIQFLTHVIHNPTLAKEKSHQFYRYICDKTRKLLNKEHPDPHDKAAAERLLSLLDDLRDVSKTDGKGNILCQSGEHEFAILKADIANLKRQLFGFMSKDFPDFPSLDLIKQLIEFNDDPVTEMENFFISHLNQKFPNVNKAKTSYEILRRQPVVSAKAGSQGGIFHFNGEDFAYKPIDPNQKYIIHTTGNTKIYDVMQKNQLGGTLCASIVNGSTSFFHPESNIGLVLDLDPACIATTYKEDVQSPMYGPNHSKEAQKIAKDFYNFHQKFQVLATYIDQIFRNSGLSSATGDDWTRYQRLLASKEKIEHELTHKPRGTSRADLEEIDQEIKTLKDKYKGNILFGQKSAWRSSGVPSFQLDTLIKHYEGHPSEDTPESFKKIFGRAPQNQETIVSEAKRCNKFLEDILSKGDVITRGNISRFLAPDELVSQTHMHFENGYFAYNEIGLDLRAETGFKPEMLGVKGMIVDRALLENKDLSQKEKDDLSQLLKAAQENSLPILVRN